MNIHIHRDKKRRKLVKKYELKRLALKRQIYNQQDWGRGIRLEAVLWLDSLPKDSSKVRVRNRCVITGRPRGVYRKFKMSRIMFRELASSGLMAGVRKASW